MTSRRSTDALDAGRDEVDYFEERADVHHPPHELLFASSTTVSSPVRSWWLAQLSPNSDLGSGFGIPCSRQSEVRLHVTPQNEFVTDVGPDTCTRTIASLLTHEAITTHKGATLMSTWSGATSSRSSPRRNRKSRHALYVSGSRLLRVWRDVVTSFVFRV